MACKTINTLFHLKITLRLFFQEHFSSFNARSILCDVEGRRKIRSLFRKKNVIFVNTIIHMESVLLSN